MTCVTGKVNVSCVTGEVNDVTCVTGEVMFHPIFQTFSASSQNTFLSANFCMV